VLGMRNSRHLFFDIIYIARKLLLGHPNTPAVVFLVYLSSLSLPVAILTIEVIQLAVIPGVFTMVFIAKDIVWP